MTIYVKDSGTWRTVAQPYVKDGGTWRAVNTQSIKDAGTWRTVFTAEEPGALWVWGDNYFGQLGDITSIIAPTPVTTFAGGTNWKQVSAGGRHSAAIKTDGTLWLWGKSDYGALGTTVEYVVNGNISIGSSIFYTYNTSGITTGLIATGNLATLGTVVSVNPGVSITFSNTYDGSIGLTGSKSGPSAFVVSSGVSFPISSISSGDTVSSYITTSGNEPEWTTVDYVDYDVIFFIPESYTRDWEGTLYITPSGGSVPFIGDLYLRNEILPPIKSTPVTTFVGGTNWKQVSCGSFYNEFSAAIKTDGTLWTWGDNTEGQLGINTAGSSKLAPVTTFAGGTNWKQVSCGRDNVAAIKTDGTLWVWGQNNGGQLGIVDSATRLTPVTTFAGGTNWKQVSCNSDHVAAIKTDGTLWLWGAGFFGKLGNNPTDHINHLRYTPITTFAGGNNWKQVNCGDSHTAAIKTDGTLWIWGRNSTGEGGIDVVNYDSYIFTPVTTFAGGTNWKEVDCGYAYTAAIKTDGTLWSWGMALLLGIDDFSDRYTPVTTFAGGTNWKQVSVNVYHTLAIK